MPAPPKPPPRNPHPSDAQPPGRRPVPPPPVPRRAGAPPAPSIPRPCGPLKPVLWVDPRAGSGELLPQFDKTKIDARLKQMEYGDFAFTGNGPHGPVSIGIERKTIGDLMGSVDGENRLFNRQLPGMIRDYDIPILLVEGMFHPVSYDPGAIRAAGDDGVFKTNSRVPYARIMGVFSALLTMGVRTIQTTGPYHTVKLITQHALWFSRPWASHTVAKPNIVKTEIRAPRAHIFSPQRGGAPFTARVFVQIDGVGPDKALALAAGFPTMTEAMAAGERDFAAVKGIGPKLAAGIHAQLHMGR